MSKERMRMRRICITPYFLIGVGAKSMLSSSFFMTFISFLDMCQLNPFFKLS